MFIAGKVWTRCHCWEYFSAESDAIWRWDAEQ